MKIYQYKHTNIFKQILYNFLIEKIYVEKRKRTYENYQQILRVQ